MFDLRQTCGCRKYQHPQVTMRAGQGLCDACDWCGDWGGGLGHDPLRGQTLKAESLQKASGRCFLLKESKQGSRTLRPPRTSSVRMCEEFPQFICLPKMVILSGVSVSQPVRNLRSNAPMFLFFTFDSKHC